MGEGEHSGVSIKTVYYPVRNVANALIAKS